MKRKYFFVLFLLILFFPFVYAGDLAISINPNNPSLSLNHGQSESKIFQITHDNYLCSISCNWQLIENNNEIVDNGIFILASNPDYNLLLSFIAPTKSEAKQESGTIECVLGIQCSEVKEWYNKCDGEDFETNIISLNYDLTQQDKEARDYLKPKLSSLKLILQDVESKEFNINSKFNSLPKNVLVSDLKQIFSQYQSSYESVKQSYESINLAFGNLDFINARNSFSSNWEIELSNIKNKLDSLNQDVEARLEKHNLLVKEINNLEANFNKLNVKSQVSQGEISSISSQIESLLSDFNSGTFTSYGSLQNRINSLNSQMDKISSSINKEFVSVLLTGRSIIENEEKKIDLNLNYSYESLEDVEALNKICTSLKGLESSFNEENNKKINEYNLEIEKIRDYNSKIEDYNQKLSPIISLRNDLSKIVNDRGINELEESACQEELEKISSMDNYDSLVQEDYSSCLKLYEDVSEINNQKQGFWFDFLSFFRKLWFDSVKFEKIDTVEEKPIPTEPILLDLESNSKSFGEKYCNLDLNVKEGSLTQIGNVKGDVLTSSNVNDVIENENLCSSFGITGKCCENDECKYNEESYPVIFLHGHAFTSWNDPAYSLDAFNNIQLALFQDKYRIGGTFLPTDKYSNMVSGEWGKVNFPITVKATYYIGVYNAEGEVISAPSKQESIDVYAKRLRDVVELVKYRTGRDKVNIIAHSMGGLVAREYIKNGGESSVNKLIMVGTPNHGIYGQVDSFCSVTGASTECGQMKSDSSFIRLLNSNDETYGNVNYYTIAGSGCVLGDVDGDGISRVQSVQLNGAKNVKVNGKCEGIFNRDFHSNLLDPSKYPQTLDYVKEFLKE